MADRDDAPDHPVTEDPGLDAAQWDFRARRARWKAMTWRERIDDLEASRSYGLVLILVIVSFTFQSAAPQAPWARVVAIILQAGTLLLAMWTSHSGERWLRVAFIGIAVAGIAAIVLAFVGGRGGAGTTALLSGLVVLAAPLVIARGVVRGILERREITVDAVFGVLAIYLLIGMVFSFLYGAIADLDPDPFFSNGSNGSPADHLYFSFVTLTTVGYGDYTAAGQLGRTTAILEAVLGQLYLVTVTALIVGNLGRRRTDPDGAADAP